MVETSTRKTGEKERTVEYGSQVRAARRLDMASVVGIHHRDQGGAKYVTVSMS